MSLLFPAMLAGLAGLAVPVVIHLIARHRFPVRDFPTIRLLRYERRDNVFARKLVDPWQLLLRLLVLALFVLAMSRFFSPTLSEDPAPRNLIVVLDASASMRVAVPDAEGEKSETPLAASKRIASGLLSEIALPSRCALLAAGDEVAVVSPMGADPQAAVAALPSVEAGDGAGPGLVRAVAHACGMVRGRREVKSQIVVLTDLRASAFQARNQQDLRQIADARAELGDALEIIVVDVGGQDVDNLAIIDARLRGGSARLRDDAQVIARVRNLGTERRAAKLVLTVGGKQEPSFRPLMLDPGEEVVVALTSYVSRSMSSFAAVLLQDRDAMLHDNVFSIPFVVAPRRGVLIVNGATAGRAAVSLEAEALGALGDGDDAGQMAMDEPIGGARILQFVLNPARELGLETTTGIDTDVVTPETLPAQMLNKYDVIILYDVNSVSEKSREDLDRFVRQGRSLLVICSKTTNPLKFNEFFVVPFTVPEVGLRGPLVPARVGNDAAFNPAVPVRLSDPQRAPEGGTVTYSPGPWLAPFRDRRRGVLSVIRLARARGVHAIKDGANILLQTEDGEVLALEAKRGLGRIVLFSFGVELSRGNIAMTRAFPELMWRLLDYLTGKLRTKPRDSLVASEPAVLGAWEPAFSPVEDLELSPARHDLRPKPLRKGAAALGLDDKQTASASPAQAPRVLPITPQRTVVVEGLPVGHFRLHKRSKTAGIAPAGSSARPITVNPDPRESDMTRVVDGEVQKLFTASARVATAEQVRRIAPAGLELLPWVVALLTAVFVIEAICGYAAGVLRSKKLESEEESEEA